jgi:hypothetical protein
MWKHIRVRYDVSIQVLITQNFMKLCFGEWRKSISDKFNVGQMVLTGTTQGRPSGSHYNKGKIWTAYARTHHTPNRTQSCRNAELKDIKLIQFHSRPVCTSITVRWRWILPNHNRFNLPVIISQTIQFPSYLPVNLPQTIQCYSYLPVNLSQTIQCHSYLPVNLS